MKLILLTLIFLSLSCSEKNGVGLPDEMTVVSEEYDFPYATLFQKAKGGDETAIQDMLQFWKKTDAGSSFCHSVYIYEILKSVGGSKFRIILNKQTKELQTRTIHWMKDRDRDLYTNYPELKGIVEQENDTASPQI